MDGCFGVFDGAWLITKFSDDEAADRYRRDVLQVDRPEHFRDSEYDDLQIHEIPDDLEIDLWQRLIQGLTVSRNRDRVIEKAESDAAA